MPSERVWQQLFLCFSFGGLGHACFCAVLFFRRRFLSFALCTLRFAPSPTLSHGERG
ncbi:hypothetical protein [Neisseria polysaccharea]|uniref:hypothetical protein n=1 Tax=Neisseria polysaccharea TaxID=489 RepID=UPI00272C26C0|nr:hypothetical protein [Neisseria polysaccharea]